MAPDQGTPTDDLDIDKLMKLKFETLKNYIEPFAADHFGNGEMALVSVAISLKRLADCAVNTNGQVYQMLTGLNSLCTITEREMKGQREDLQAIKSAIWSLDSTTRNNDGRELRITIAKD